MKRLYIYLMLCVTFMVTYTTPIEKSGYDETIVYEDYSDGI